MLLDRVPSRLEIDVHLVDGNVEKFDQDNSTLLQEYFHDFDPQKIFSTRHIVIETNDGVFAYPPEAVCWMEFRMEAAFKAAERGPRVEWISQAKFREDRKSGKLHRDQIQNLKPGDPYNSHVVVEFRNGQKLYCCVHGEMVVAVEQKMIIPQMLGNGTLQIALPGRGFIFANRATVVRIGMYPGAPKITPNSWKMNCV